MSQKPPLQGHGSFVWIKPRKGRVTEYELYTVGQQSSPSRWLKVDWPVRFEDGRAPFSECSTALRCSSWEDFRDPAQMWQRPYVDRANREEQTLEALIPEALRDGLAGQIRPAWLHEVLGKYYAAWPFVEYGQFLALCYAVREALAETITFALAFQASDTMRHSQDIVHLIFELQERCPGFTDQAARPAWMSDPVLVPLRENVEHICSSNDWAEIVVATNLVLEPIACDLAETEFFARNAAHNGDPVTSIILAGVRRDARRNLEATKALVRHVCADSQHGPENRTVIRQWLDRWTPLTEKAALALRGLFELPGINSDPFEPSYDRVRQNQRAVVQELGLDAGGTSDDA